MKTLMLTLVLLVSILFDFKAYSVRVIHEEGSYNEKGVVRDCYVDDLRRNKTYGCSDADIRSLQRSEESFSDRDYEFDRPGQYEEINDRSFKWKLCMEWQQYRLKNHILTHGSNIPFDVFLPAPKSVLFDDSFDEVEFAAQHGFVDGFSVKVFEKLGDTSLFVSMMNKFCEVREMRR